MPLTVCRITPATRYLVVEMGARGIGHVEYLTHIAPPHVAIVLNVGTAHVGEFGSRDNIALAKSELPKAVPADGLSILNADDPVVAAMASGLQSRVQLVGLSPDAEVRAEDVVVDKWAERHTTSSPRRGARGCRCSSAVPTTWPTHSPWRRQRSSSGCRSTALRRHSRRRRR